MGFIYKITNNINNKIYIGKTTQTVGRRFTEHKRDSKTRNTYLYYAMRKYGIENFFIDTIEEVPNQELNDREIYWIDFYKSNNNENGYNLTSGGDGKSHVDICTIKEMEELWNKGLTITEISKTLSLYIATVQYYLENFCSTYSKEEQKKRGLIRNINKHCKKVIQYNLNGDYIATFNSISEASNQLNIGFQRISDCCKKITSNVDTYQFIFDGDAPPGKCENPTFIHKPICQKDLFGNIINMYINANVAARKLNVDPSCIRRCCYKEKKTCKGYVWEFVSEIDYVKYYQSKNHSIDDITVQTEHLKAVI